MNSTNMKTLQTYQDKIEEYVKNTPHQVDLDPGLQEWLDISIKDLSVSSQIFEIGSGFGRDAKYIQEQGLNVQTSDAVEGFVNILRNDGFKAAVFNPLEQEFPSSYDLILATAVLLHFNKEEIHLVISKAFEALNEDGRLAFTVKKGEGEKWVTKKLSAPRYYRYWQSEPLIKILGEIGFTKVYVHENEQGYNEDLWLRVVATK